MASEAPHSDKYHLEYEAFSKYLKGKLLTPGQFLVLGFKSVLMLFEGLVRYIPGGFGFKLRYYFYKPLLKHLGKNVLIDVGVHLNGAANISIDDYTWIDTYCKIEASLGSITIGKRVHMAAFSIIGARSPVTIGDFAGIGAGARIYANSAVPRDGKRMSGPMIPEEFKAFKSEPVVMGKDSFLGTNSVMLPGSELGEGCVVGANCVVNSKLAAYSIYSVAPPRKVGERLPVTGPDDYEL